MEKTKTRATKVSVEMALMVLQKFRESIQEMEVDEVSVHEESAENRCYATFKSGDEVLTISVNKYSQTESDARLQELLNKDNKEE